MAIWCVKGRVVAQWAGHILVLAGLLMSTAPSSANIFEHAHSPFAVPADIGPLADPYISSTPWVTKQPPVQEPFRAELGPSENVSLDTKWSGVKRALHNDQSVLQRCRVDASACPAAARAFLAIIDRAESRDGWSRIAEVNRSINFSIRAVSDKEQYGVRDLWATPLLMFTSRAGDCEDLAIAKYAALRELGYADNDLRLVIANERVSGEVHAVLTVRHDGRWLILDNKTLEIKDDTASLTLDPLFTIDSTGVHKITALSPKPEDTPWSAAAARPLPVYIVAAWPMMSSAL
jgi:predicted transglutaminase-like cysteine proteinase